ncbi:MAG: hypothetical protein WCP85_18250 [Mariniphaga sp.]
MKRQLFFLTFILLAYLGMAQETKQALGLRLGGNDGFGTSISYQYGLSDLNRLEFDLGMHSGHDYNSWGLGGIYQWVWDIDKGFSWYAGAGGKIGSWNWESNYAGTKKSGMFLSAAGNVGIEYTFPIKIQVSLDAMPTLGLINDGEAFGTDIALSVRYRF